jgi:hypothetical protein
VWLVLLLLARRVSLKAPRVCVWRAVLRPPVGMPKRRLRGVLGLLVGRPDRDLLDTSMDMTLVGISSEGESRAELSTAR